MQGPAPCVATITSLDSETSSFFTPTVVGTGPPPYRDESRGITARCTATGRFNTPIALSTNFSLVQFLMDYNWIIFAVILYVLIRAILSRLRNVRTFCVALRWVRSLQGRAAAWRVTLTSREATPFGGAGGSARPALVAGRLKVVLSVTLSEERPARQPSSLADRRRHEAHPTQDPP